jgi:phosphate uptake regulator
MLILRIISPNRQLSEKIERRQKELDRLEDQILSLETRASQESPETVPRSTTRRDRKYRRSREQSNISVDDLSRGDASEEEESEEDLLGGRLID